jgi:hypothetical protein
MRNVKHYFVVFILLLCAAKAVTQAWAQSKAAGVTYLEVAESCSLTRRSLEISQCSGLALLKAYVGSCMGRDPNDAASYLVSAATKAADDAAMQAALKSLEKQCAVKRTEVCDVSNTILALEAMAESVEAQGIYLKNLVQLALPEYPPLAFSIQTSAKDIAMTIEDPDSYWQWIHSTAGSANAIIGLFTDLPPAIPLFSNVDSGPFSLLNSNIASSVIAGLDSLNGAMIKYRQTDSQQNGQNIVQFLINQGETLGNVLKLREGMICALKHGTTDYFSAYSALKSQKQTSLQTLANDERCQDPSQTELVAGYRRAINAKTQNLDKDFNWLDGSVLGFVHRQGMGGWAPRGIWLEKEIMGNTIASFSTVDCSQFTSQKP